MRKILGRMLIVIVAPIWFPPLALLSAIALLGGVLACFVSWLIFGDSERLGDKYEGAVFDVMDGLEEAVRIVTHGKTSNERGTERR